MTSNLIGLSLLAGEPAIVVEVPDDVEDALPWVLSGWENRTAYDAATPEIAVTVDGEHYVVRSARIENGSIRTNSRILAATILASALTVCYVARRFDFVQLHAAANIIGDRAVLLVAPSRGGKSSLSITLASRGHRLVTDDRLALRVNRAGGTEALTLGVAPKLRLPLPLNGNAALGAFAERHAGAMESEIMFLDLPHDVMLPPAELVRVGAFVILDRGDHPTIAMEEPDKADVMRSLLAETQAPHLEARELVERARQIVAAVPGYRLKYSVSHTAAEHLSNLFG